MSRCVLESHFHVIIYERIDLTSSCSSLLFDTLMSEVYRSKGDDATAVIVFGRRRHDGSADETKKKCTTARRPLGMEYVRNEDKLSGCAAFESVPSVPPTDDFATWDEYAKWLSTDVQYRDELWGREHDKLISSSSAGRYLGLGPSTPESELRRCYTTEPRSRVLCYIMERGYCLELLHAELFRIFCPGYRLERCEHSFLHPEVRCVVATPDAFLYDGATTNRVAALAEFKTHVTDAKRMVDPVHMCQMQIAMSVMNVDRCYYSSLSMDDATLQSEWVVILVRRSEEYWRRAVPILLRFARAVLLRGTAPKRGEFEPPEVATEMVIARRNVLDTIGKDAGKRVAEALSLARRGADEAYARELRIWETLRQQQLQQQQQRMSANDDISLV